MTDDNSDLFTITHDVEDTRKLIRFIKVFYFDDDRYWQISQSYYLYSANNQCNTMVSMCKGNQNRCRLATSFRLLSKA